MNPNTANPQVPQPSTPPAIQPQAPILVGTLPPEAVSANPGRTEGIIAIVCAVIALLFFPPIFGILAIILGIRANKKGAKTLGLVGIILGAVFMVLGIAFGIWVNVTAHHAKGLIFGALLK